MGLINTALHIGQSAITSYQSALSVVGNNIANAANSDYTRQRAVLQPVIGAPLPGGIQPGGGVALTSLERIINEALEGRLRLALGDAESARIQSNTLTQIETGFNELTENDLSTMMSRLFNSFQDVQNNPTDVGLRSVAIGNAAALADALRIRQQGLNGLSDELNTQIVASVQQADELARQIADLNIQVVEAEAGGQIAGALRDTRDALLRELAEIVEITVRTQDSGTVSVFVGNETLVQFGNSRGLTTQTVVDGDLVREEVHFGDNSGQAEIRGGLLEGLLTARDTYVTGAVDVINRLAVGLISALNEIHTNGQGLDGFGSVTGTYAVTDANLALNDSAAGLTFVPRTGSFFISITDMTGGQTVSYRIDVDLDGENGDDTTLNSLAAQIDGTAANLTATVGVDGKLTLTADAGFAITFGHDGAAARDDTSNVLAALGINTLFQGINASDIAVNDVIAARPELLAASAVNINGDGANMGLLADAGNNNVAELNNVTVFNFYNQTLGEMGVQTASAAARLDGAAATSEALQQQRASISGVNLDEEAVDLLRYQRAFQGAARFTSIIDRLIAELLSIAR
ncbi:MAG: flagellar hook-associated protein FlgK [Planctomycetes bacterium]|nr:flagellar hook-associated protein FlgK [Planctomycetota bacterium]